MLQRDFKSHEWEKKKERKKKASKYNKLPKKAIANLTVVLLFLKVEIPSFTTQLRGRAI